MNEAVMLGARIIPAVRHLLSERDPSGLFHMRVRAVDTLVALGAYDVLADFLRSERTIPDPVEQLGEDVVIDAAARGIARSRQQWAFELLLALSGQPRLTSGVIAALGSFRRRESIPILIAALAEDEVRMPAEAALKAIGHPATPALIDAANLRLPSAANESEFSLRRRRSALSLLVDIGCPARSWPRMRGLMAETDTQIVLLACRLCIHCAGKRERQGAVDRLQGLRHRAGWLELIQIDRYLSECGIPTKGIASGA